MSFAAQFSTQSLGALFAVIGVTVVTVYLIVNVLRGGKRELGSEIELAANRKPYLSDEELEGPKIVRTQLLAFGMLITVAVGLPMYWITEPGRQTDTKVTFNDRFAHEGEELFEPTGGENTHALGCAGCHGGMKATGGTAAYNLLGPDGSLTITEWKAPALNTVLLRYSREEVVFILTYGRPFSPMQAWGVAGGGPLDDQQIQVLVDYLETIQLTPEQAQQEASEQLAKMMVETGPDGQPLYQSEGEALFNMGLTDGFAGGAYSCGRCHTQGWSIASSYADVEAISGCGALGPSLCGSAVEEQFPAEAPAQECKPVEPASAAAEAAAAATTTTTAPPGAPTTVVLPDCASPFQAQIDFISEGSEYGKRYGKHGQGSGKMPGFGTRPAEPALFWINKGVAREPGPGMLSEDLIAKIVEYERSL